MIVPSFIRPLSILPLISPFLCCGANVYNKSKSHKDRPCLTQPSRTLIASSWTAMFTNHSWRFLGPSVFQSHLEFLLRFRAQTLPDCCSMGPDSHTNRGMRKWFGRAHRHTFAHSAIISKHSEVCDSLLFGEEWLFGHLAKLLLNALR